MTPNPITRPLDFHGSTLAVSAEPDAWALLDSRLKRFPRANAGSPGLVVEFFPVRSPDHSIAPPRGPTRVIYEYRAGRVVYADKQDQLFANYPSGVRALCDFAQGKARIAYHQTDENVWLATHHLFTLFLIEWLKRRRLYSVHAAAVCINDQGLLFAGPTGAGKSTLALALARGGFQILGDDLVFLASKTRGLCALAFPEDIDITPGTRSLFPELDSSHLPQDASRRKLQIDPEVIFGTAMIWQCEPRVLVLPRVVANGPGVLREIDRGEALVELAPNVLLTEPRSSQRHLDALAALVNTCLCYRLETGRDLADLPQLFREVMNRGRAQ